MNNKQDDDDDDDDDDLHFIYQSLRLAASYTVVFSVKLYLYGAKRHGGVPPCAVEDRKWPVPTRTKEIVHNARGFDMM